MAKKNEDVEPGIPKNGAQKVEKWAAIAGRWEFAKKGANARYLGSDDAGSGRAAFGIAIAPQKFRDGRIRTSLKLSRNADTTAGVVFGYQSLSSPYVIVQIGGWGRAYSIGEYLPEVGWVNRKSAGSLLNLSIDEYHELEVRVAGQVVEVAVDGIDVLRNVLPEPIEGTGVGLYSFGDANVEFAETTIDQKDPRAFVIMPFKEPFDTLYKEVINPVAKQAGFDVNRVDEIYGPGIILNDIQQQIEESQAVVAEISSHNPNVFYELGYAHALKKPAVLLVRRQEGEQMPFDIRSFRAIFHDDSIGGKKNVETHLRQHLNAILRDSYSR